jgi:hypothetical protein
MAGMAIGAGAQIGQQLERILVFHNNPLPVNHGQGKARPLQQGPRRANIDQRREPGRHTTPQGQLGLHQALTQFAQRIAAGNDREKQSIRAQGAMNLGQHAGQIIHPLQSQHTHDQIARLGCKRQRLLIGYNPQAAIPASVASQKRLAQLDLNYLLHPRPGGKGRAQKAVHGSHYSATGKMAAKIIKPVEQARTGFLV